MQEERRTCGEGRGSWCCGVGAYSAALLAPGASCEETAGLHMESCVVKWHRGEDCRVLAVEQPELACPAGTYSTTILQTQRERRTEP